MPRLVVTCLVLSIPSGIETVYILNMMMVCLTFNGFHANERDPERYGEDVAKTWRLNFLSVTYLLTELSP
jgi:hypothetical protein